MKNQTAPFIKLFNKTYDLFPAPANETEKELTKRFLSIEKDGYFMVRRGNDLYGRIIEIDRTNVIDSVPAYEVKEVEQETFEYACI